MTARRYTSYIRNDCSPEAWEVERTNFLAAYYRRLCSDDRRIRANAAKAFVSYELAVSTTFPNHDAADRVLSTPEILVPFALFEAHYMLHNGFLRRGQLLDDVAKLAHLGITIVHGRCDFVCRPEAARVHRADSSPMNRGRRRGRDVDMSPTHRGGAAAAT